MNKWPFTNFLVNKKSVHKSSAKCVKKSNLRKYELYLHLDLNQSHQSPSSPCQVAMAPKKRSAPATRDSGGSKSKASKKGELPPVSPDALAMPHMKLLDEWMFRCQHYGLKNM